MAWGVRNLISTQVNANVKGGLKVRVLSDAGAPLCGRAANITGPADTTRRRLLLVSDLAERATGASWTSDAPSLSGPGLVRWRPPQIAEGHAIDASSCRPRLLLFQWQLEVTVVSFFCFFRVKPV